MSLQKEDLKTLPYRLLGKSLSPILPQFQGLKPKIAKSGMRITFEAYVAIVILAPIIVGVVTVVLAFFAGLITNVPITNLISMVAGAGLVFGTVVFFASYMYPSFRVDARKEKIDQEFPYVTSDMAILAMAGHNIESIFRSVAQYPKSVIADECKLIIRDVDMLGFDIYSSLKTAITRSPSKKFSEFLESFIGIAQTGGALGPYLLSISENVMIGQRTLNKSLIAQLGMMSEGFVALLIVFPLILILLGSIMGLLTQSIGGISLELFISLVTYAYVPICGTMMIIMFDMKSPSK